LVDLPFLLVPVILFLQGLPSWQTTLYFLSPSSDVLDALHLTPGDCVSGDHLESTSPGLIPTYRGSFATKKYHAGTLFIEHASRFLYFTPHISIGCQEALGAKHHFELLASHHNRSIKCYHTDHDIFASKDFQCSCIHKNNILHFVE
jgi:hypothetical protein